ncbi:PREDICTED: sialic acid-binding Ig-like lectin 16 isoform X2 [Gekko japonicus]|uniref:C-Answer n=1 Tax=Gekko japonicus TaxID=146911 RepID=A0A516EYX9_GEKJA|nr:PREDICTED: sialic acid-binding Ig-like lectin 16 isoform X1 [Gekko japonicus]XP_015263979.1 PREDICTED: sialic acid-binding Ig-like lectin 16 isoform X2 [Gekko japonicus]QDO71699.1 c-Answer [Gekko japonicus]
MAHFPRRVWLLSAALAVALRAALAGVPIIHLSAQDGPFLEGSNVTLECLTDEEGEDLSGFFFQKYSKWLHRWISLDSDSHMRCWFYDVTVSHQDGRLLLSISNLQSWHTGPYRCASSNATGNASVSEAQDLRVEYLHNVFLTRSNTWCGTIGETVTVVEGANLELLCYADASKDPIYEWSWEGNDGVVASNALTLPKVTQEQEGTYTCQAQHPSLPQLTKTKSVQVFVESSERSFTLESVLPQSAPMLALTVAVPAVLLLLVVMVFSVLIHRHRAVAKKKALLEDSGQRTPIYKGSLESVPSIVVGDTHPLVM